MAKALKVLLWVVGGLVAVVGLALAGVALFFDPNDHKDAITKAAKDATGRELRIKGELELNVFPWLAIGIGETTLSNAEGFGDTPMLEFRQISAGLKLLPLILSRSVELRTVTVDGLSVRLAKNAQGVSNWDDLVKPTDEKPEEAKPEPPKDGEFSLASLNIGGVAITDANLAYEDAQTGNAYRVENLRLETGALVLGQPMPLEFSCLLTSVKPELAAEVKLAAQITADLAARLYSIDGLALAVTARGAPIPAGRQDVTLNGDIRFDQSQGAFSLKELVVGVAGLTLKAAIEGQGLNTETPALSGRIGTEVFSPRALAANLGIKLPATADPAVLGEASLSANYAGSFKRAALSDLAIKLDQTTLSGSLDVSDFATQTVSFALKVDAFDADRYLPPAAADAPVKEGEAPAKTGDINKAKVDVEPLDKLNVAGDFEIGALTVKNLKLADVKMNVSARPGAAKNQSLSANFYGGRIEQSAKITPGARPGFVLTANTTKIDSGAAARDFLRKDVIAGLANLKLNVTTGGITVGDLRRALNGDLAFSFENGAVKGFNLAKIIRDSKAAFGGGATAATEETKQTDFAELRGTGKIVNGVLSNNDLSAKSPLFRLAGAGTIDLIAEQLDYLAKPTVVSTSKGQGGRDLDDLKGLTIPIKLYGSLLAPQWKIEWGEILKAKASEKVDKEVERGKEKLQEKLNEKLGDLFKLK